MPVWFIIIYGDVSLYKLIELSIPVFQELKEIIVFCDMFSNTCWSCLCSPYVKFPCQNFIIGYMAWYSSKMWPWYQNIHFGCSNNFSQNFVQLNIMCNNDMRTRTANLRIYVCHVIVLLFSQVIKINRLV